jgi:hypothetical protein
MIAALILSMTMLAHGQVVCEATEQALTLAYPKISSLKKPVNVHLKIENGFLVANFKVKTPTRYTKDPMGPNEFPYNFDVVGLFVTASETNYPYYEFEVTPLGQTYQVEIQAPGKFIGGVDLGLQSRAKITGTEWAAEMKIPLEKIRGLGDPSKLKGNAFGVFGKKLERTYWSLNLPPQKKPQFHLPQFFLTFFPAACTSATEARAAL